LQENAKHLHEMPIKQDT